MQATKEKSIVFQTHGEINPGTWELMGLSVKNNSDSIGMFGTGFKYAIAVLLRTGHKVVIHCESGKTYEFGLIDMEFRGSNFQRIHCNNQPLAFTTHYGFKWTVDQAYRELMSNTMDESGICFISEDPIKNGTTIVVTGDGILESHSRHDQIFIGDRTPIAKTKKINFYRGKGDVWFRGVKVFGLEEANWSYEVLCDMDLTEDRTLKNTYFFMYLVGAEICSNLKDKKLIKSLITSQGIESQFDYDNVWSKEMEEVAMDVWANNPSSLSEKIAKILKQRNPSIGFNIVDFTEDEEEMVRSACDFLKEAGYPVNCQIHRVKCDNPKTIAYYHQGAMHLTDKAFEEGSFELVQTIFEESCHNMGLSDYSLDFQQYLIKQVIIQARKRLKKSI
jgi:hypothetical protein